MDLVYLSMVGAQELLAHLRAHALPSLPAAALKQLHAFDAILEHILTVWFSRAVLLLKRIEWTDSALQVAAAASASTAASADAVEAQHSLQLLQHVMKFETVHPVKQLSDLQQRMGAGRRCFALFHPQLSVYPLVFVSVALTSRLTACVQDLLHTDTTSASAKSNRSEFADETAPGAAIFYSICSCHDGTSHLLFICCCPLPLIARICWSQVCTASG